MAKKAAGRKKAAKKKAAGRKATVAARRPKATFCAMGKFSAAKK